MTPTTLRVRARGTASVTDFERMEQIGMRAFIGRKLTEVSPGQHGFAPMEEAVEIPFRAEYVQALRDGDLWAADQATADACSLPNAPVAFDPTFGGVVPAKSKSAPQQPSATPAEKA